MGSGYDFVGRRWDYRLFLDLDSRYERTICGEGDATCPSYSSNDAGRWAYDEEEHLLHLESASPTEDEPCSSGDWEVLAVHTCEGSNVLLVLRKAILASRNLPILFYRVHGGDRAYGTGWLESLRDGSPEKEVLPTARDKRIQELEAENERLKKEFKTALGDLDDQI